MASMTGSIIGTLAHDLPEVPSRNPETFSSPDKCFAHEQDALKDQNQHV